MNESRNARVDRETPTSFIERLATGLRAHAGHKRAAISQIRTGFSEVPIVAGRVDMLAGIVNGTPVWDARLYSLMVTSAVTRDPDNPAWWVPGREQTRVLSLLGTSGEFDPNYALTELAAAGVEDAIQLERQARVAAEAERDRLRAEVDELWPIKAHVDAAKARLGVTQMSLERDVAAAARDARAAALSEAMAQAETPQELPQGVYAHGKKYRAQVRVNGKPRQADFETVEQAAEQVEAWKAEREAVAA